MSDTETQTDYTWLDPMDYQDVLGEITYKDDKDKFVSFVNSILFYPGICPQFIIDGICLGDAVKCAAALIEGETSQKIDFNATLYDGCTPLHCACACARACPKIVELFLRHGARTDIRCSDENRWYYGMLPLNVVLYQIRNYCRYRGHRWTPRQSILKLIILLCLPCKNKRDKLQSIRLLLGVTKNVEEEIFHYVKAGKLVELAALLIVAHEMVLSPTFFQTLCGCSLDGCLSVRQFLISEIALLISMEIRSLHSVEHSIVARKCKEKLVIMKSMLLLLEVFERVGDKISAYLEQVPTDCPEQCEQVAKEVGMLLSDAGFTLKSEDYDVTNVKSSKCGTLFTLEFLARNKTRFEGLIFPHCLDSKTLASLLIKERRAVPESREMELEEEIGEPKFVKHLDNKNTDYAKWRFAPLRYVLGSSNSHRLPLKASSDSKTIPILGNECNVLNNLPVTVSLEKLCNQQFLKDWTAEKSVFKLLYLLCLPELKKPLESIRRLAFKTEKVEDICCHYVKKGKLIELAALLLVTWEKWMNTNGLAMISQKGDALKTEASMVLHQCILSEIKVLIDKEMQSIGKSSHLSLACKGEMAEKRSALLLLEVFERTGESLYGYLQSVGFKEVSRNEMAKNVQWLVRTAGFVLMKHKDTNLTEINCFSSELIARKPEEFIRSPRRDVVGVSHLAGSRPLWLDRTQAPTNHRLGSPPPVFSLVQAKFVHPKLPSNERFFTRRIHQEISLPALRLFHTSRMVEDCFGFDMSGSSEIRTVKTRESWKPNFATWRRWVSFRLAITKGLKRL